MASGEAWMRVLRRESPSAGCCDSGVAERGMLKDGESGRKIAAQGPVKRGEEVRARLRSRLTWAGIYVSSAPSASGGARDTSGESAMSGLDARRAARPFRSQVTG